MVYDPKEQVVSQTSEDRRQKMVQVATSTANHVAAHALSPVMTQSRIKCGRQCEDLSICLSMTSSVTIVSRADSRNNDPMEKEHLRIHNNGFILNTGVTLIVILFSNSPPIEIPHSKETIPIQRRLAAFLK
ncbi:hypothetical protein KIN20_016932 [Parelaphostrongylus tenuis]|uniref:Uncharacterized protein n=1 Tax=Parelaphostrongylus tenuis TaxID=148309 RepID=A0AAD5MKS2_PARTN|nr:hypothetical protein KIN20_016930 [Parelaphostrongylus tenuis]KAJ1358493.1 hypothetical protein KIN20_016932 [Parelaphostrongylus tenuis]